MAEGGNAPWRCDTCDVRFTYKSKLDRHVTTAKHKALEACCVRVSALDEQPHSDLEDMSAEAMQPDAADVSDILCTRVWLSYRLDGPKHFIHYPSFGNSCDLSLMSSFSDFVDTVKDCQPELLQKVKIHLLLHLVDNMLDFGPCSSFNTERSETKYTHDYVCT